MSRTALGYFQTPKSFLCEYDFLPNLKIAIGHAAQLVRNYIHVKNSSVYWIASHPAGYAAYLPG